MRAYSKEYYKKNTSALLAVTQARYDAFKAWLEELKAETSCADCDQYYPACCMDFDHIRGKKSFGIANGAGRDRQVVLAEIAKCELVCANCHRIRTYLRNRKLWKPGT